MYIRFEDQVRDDHYIWEMAYAYDNENSDVERMSAKVKTINSRYHGHLVRTQLFGGVHTAPEFRRHGYVRQFIDQIFQMAPERGWMVSMIHPFSFSYYNKFGYERIADHLILSFPMSKLEYIPRCSDFVKLGDDPERLRDILQLFDKFSSDRNIMFERYNDQWFETGTDIYEKVTYIRYHGQEPVAYVTLGVDAVLNINHKDSTLNIYELGFTSPEALTEVLGFLRMFEGQSETVIVHNCAMMPELDMALRHYTHTSYRILPDIMARVLDTEGMLKLNRYPDEPGHFTLGVDDPYPFVAGVFDIEYGNGQAEVRRIADKPGCTACDLICNSSAISQLLYGYYQITPELLRYQSGVEVCGSTTDFCRAFPKAQNGLFEHF